MACAQPPHPQGAPARGWVCLMRVPGASAPKPLRSACCACYARCACRPRPKRRSPSTQKTSTRGPLTRRWCGHPSCSLQEPPTPQQGSKQTRLSSCRARLSSRRSGALAQKGTPPCRLLLQHRSGRSASRSCCGGWRPRASRSVKRRAPCCPSFAHPCRRRNMLCATPCMLNSAACLACVLALEVRPGRSLLAMFRRAGREQEVYVLRASLPRHMPLPACCIACC